LFRRLRAWNVSSWRYADRISRTRAALDTLAQLATDYDNVQRPAVPEVGVHALADQLEVLTADAIDSGVPVDEVDAVLSDLAEGLGLSIG